jgi:hypothetical protein
MSTVLATRSPHGSLWRYALGCRCTVCRQTKGDYDRAWSLDTRRLRAAKRDQIAATGQRYVVDGITHGLAGYRKHQCRCYVCAAANTEACRAYRARRKHRAA